MAKRKRGLSRSGRSSNGRPYLDACLIVRNEELHLPGCLESLLTLAPLLHRINVYDTGSTDRTVEIARAAGCTVVEGYWDDDFARARNESLAMSGAEWALVIDADERAFADPARLERVLRGIGDANVVDAELYHLDGDGERSGHTRYIKAVRPGRIRFVHPIHEVVDARPGHVVRIASLPPEEVNFTHLGYATQEIRRTKAARNLGVADAAVREARRRKDDALLVHALRQRARSRVGPGSLDDSLADLREAWAVCPVGSGGWMTCGLDIAERQYQRGDLEAARKMLVELEDIGGRSARWLKAHAEILLADGDLAAAGHEADELLRHSMQPAENSLDMDRFDRREALDLRLRVALHAQERQVAVAVLVLLVEQGEVERIAALCDLWAGPPHGLAAMLVRAARGAHGPAVIGALRTLPGLGRHVAEALETPAAATQNG